MKRAFVILAAVAGLLGACGDDTPQPAAARAMLKANPQAAEAWPLLLRHCQNTPNCDPMGEIGLGANEASGAQGLVMWRAQTADAATGGADYGAAILLSAVGQRGQGGAAGRPVAVSEMAATLRAGRDRKSWLSVEYRFPPNGTAEPYFLSLRTAHLALPAPGARETKTRDKLVAATESYLDSLVWPGGETGARIEITGKDGVLWRAYTGGMPGEALQTGEQVLKQGFEPWMLYASRNIRDEPLPGLIAALRAGETLSLKATAPDGGVMLSDALYASGYSDALAEASAALADAFIAAPIPERCARFADEPDAFWKIADVTPALRVCDPRTPEQKLAAERSGEAPVQAVVVE